MIIDDMRRNHWKQDLRGVSKGSVASHAGALNLNLKEYNHIRSISYGRYCKEITQEAKVVALEMKERPANKLVPKCV